MPDLDELRTELATIDRDLLALIARRQAVAQQIGHIKRASGIPVRDFRQEREVVERARAAASAAGLSPQLGEELVLTLIRASLPFIAINIAALIVISAVPQLSLFLPRLAGF